MDTDKETLPEYANMNILAAVAAAPEPMPGHDRDRETLALLVPDASESELNSMLKLVADLRTATDSELGNRSAVPNRLTKLRSELASHGLAGFLIPHADENQGEYLPPGSQRLTWISGFTGSAGLAVVLADAAAIAVDGRYTLQVQEQVDASLFEIRHITKEPISDWIAKHLPVGGRLGYDPWHFTARDAELFAKSCRKMGGKLVAIDSNPLDAIWTDQPPPPVSPSVPHPERFSGESHVDKRSRVSSSIAKEGADAAFLAAPDSIAWLLNVRGADVPNTPLTLSFAILHKDSTVDWFVDRRKLPSGTHNHLGKGIQVRSTMEIGPILDTLTNSKVLLDPTSSPAWVTERMKSSGVETITARDPCQLPKARKNQTELQGMRAAHVRDGAALTRFLAWLAREAPTGNVDELSAAASLATFRAEAELFQGLSFDTISGAGSHGAIVHYRATPDSNRLLQQGELYLVDSGGQYLDGTTDVTRTIIVGEPTAEMRERFTLVLRGHINLAMARFPEGTTGPQLDTLARAALWSAGLDFDHGTGHGVGAYLSVHEGPQGISARAAQVPLKPGMILSNEPGYYKPGAYGIRIENLVAVVEAAKPEGGERPLLQLETLTLAPIDRSLIVPEMLRPEELAWLDAYHARISATLMPLLDRTTAKWLVGAAAPLA